MYDDQYFFMFESDSRAGKGDAALSTTVSKFRGSFSLQKRTVSHPVVDRILSSTTDIQRLENLLEYFELMRDYIQLL